jgi:TonB-dependent receptor
MRNPLRFLAFSFLTSFLYLTMAFAQEDRGTITGKVSDPRQAVLAGARIEVQPGGKSAVSDANGAFSINGLKPGLYTVTVSDPGFTLYSAEVMVSADKPSTLDAILQIGTQNESVTVTGEREGGEVEALTIERTADNIVQVLPADVIQSLPNTNIADAVGRMPSVSLERDEGEGKYVQIRGTEPRYNNATIDGIHVPSPEGIRNVKLDVIPADLVSSVEINKTLSPNQDADAIGGSVNLVTRTPADQPYVSLMGMGGYTPITGGRKAYQFDGTAGQRFGHDHKFGALFGFSYDYNARGIDDLEPAQAVNPLPDGSTFNGPSTEDLRNYHYDRSRYGFDGELDYKLGEMSSIYLRGLFSHFKDYGEDWIYTPAIVNFITDTTDANNTCGISSVGGVQGCGNMTFADVYRKPEQQIFSVQTGARHLFGGAVLTWGGALGQANFTHGFSHANFSGPGTDIDPATGNPRNNVAFGVDTKDPFVPKFPVLNGVNIYDPTKYSYAGANTENDGIFERDIVGDISFSKPYSVGGHFSTFEIGFKGWDAHKTSLVDRENFNDTNTYPMTQFLSGFHDNNYYFKQFTYGPVVQYTKILSAIAAAGTSPDQVTNWSNDWDIGERIWAGYAMDTIDLGKFRLQGGVRVEATSDALVGNTIDISGPTPALIKKNTSYTNVFPSVQGSYRFDSDTILRVAYGIGIARPNFQDMAPYQNFDPTPGLLVPVSAGNPNLIPTKAQNFDVLGEHYMKNVGLIQAGFFYKALTNPIYYVNTTVPQGYPYAGLTENAPLNGPSAHITGFEASWQQPLKFLPGLLNGMGVRANYGYTTSRASFPANYGRTDHPTLARTAPNNWNFDVTYDKRGFSARMGLTHNDAYIWSYGGGNAKDPSGDTYLYPHTQMDAQVSYWIPRGHGIQAVVSLLNLNNETFGFYNGAEAYPIQREYYSRTISAGLRWTPFMKEPH